MRPAFPSTRSAVAFALLLLVLLTLPLTVGKKLLPTRKEAYTGQGWKFGPYPWIRNQIFEETNDIDIAFMGSSHMFNGIDTPYVQARLSEQLGRPAVVRTIAWGGAGFDALYFIARDLLEHRRVRMLVFYDEIPIMRQRNNQHLSWFRWREDAGVLSGLPLADQGFFYYAAIVGMPRNLLCLLRPEEPAPLVTAKSNWWTVLADAPNPATVLGCLLSPKGFAPNAETARLPFKPYFPAKAARPEDAVIYSEATKTNFEFLSAPVPAWHEHFVRKFGELLHEHGTLPVMLYLPMLADIRSPTISERRFWPDLFPRRVVLLGIPPAKLYGQLTDAEVLNFYGDPYHFNRNGEEYMSHLITPALFNLYEDHPPH